MFCKRAVQNKKHGYTKRFIIYYKNRTRSTVQKKKKKKNIR